MRITLRGTAGDPGLDARIRDMLEWLGPCYGEVKLPVRVTLFRLRGRGTSASALWPCERLSESRRLRGHSVRTYEVEFRLGTALAGEKYPRTWTYRKRAGPVVCMSMDEAIFHTLAHELRHVEQFDACRRTWPRGVAGETGPDAFRVWEQRYQARSCEVDAEVVARDLLRCWRATRVAPRTQGGATATTHPAKSLTNPVAPGLQRG